MSICEWDAYDLWTAADDRAQRVSVRLEVTLRDVGLYAVSQNPRLNRLVDFTVDQARYLEADKYETQAAADELFAAWSTQFVVTPKADA